jgi:hypothetical protein
VRQVTASLLSPKFPQLRPRPCRIDANKCRIDVNKCRIDVNKCRIDANKCRIDVNKCRIAKCEGGHPLGGRPHRTNGVGKSVLTVRGANELLVESLGLVVDRDGHLTQPLGVLATVVRAKQQLAAAVESYSHVGLGCAAVASVGRGKGGSRGYRRGHVVASFRCAAGYTSPQHQTTSFASPDRRPKRGRRTHSMTRHRPSRFAHTGDRGRYCPHCQRIRCVAAWVRGGGGSRR